MDSLLSGTHRHLSWSHKTAAAIKVATRVSTVLLFISTSAPFKISDTAYETVITNLDSESFPPDELKRLYGMRWGIETSFRELKYTVGLLHFHAKKVENITQEIFARLIMYNFAELITSHVVIRKPNRKYPYKANFSVAVQVCRQFLLGNISPPDVEATIGRNVSVTRSGRSNPRNMAVKRAISFLYRVA